MTVDAEWAIDHRLAVGEEKRGPVGAELGAPSTEPHTRVVAE